MTEPLVSLMRAYCIDYTNSHDLSVCDAIMEPDYVVHITGMQLERDTAYKPAVEAVFERFPHLGLVVHQLVTNGDRLAMSFSEHGATPEGRLACWSGISLYDWNGRRLTSCRVEQDFWSQQRQLRTGSADPLDPPHIDPWTTTRTEEPDARVESVVRSWLANGHLAACSRGRIDEGPAASYSPVIKTSAVTIHDLFSAGDRVAFHATLSGEYIGGAQEASLHVAGIVGVADGRVDDVQIVTDRMGTHRRLRGRRPE